MQAISDQLSQAAAGHTGADVTAASQPEESNTTAKSERVQQLFEHFPAGALISILAAGGIALHFAEVLHHDTWFFTMVGVATLQLLVWAVHRSGWLKPFTPTHWAVVATFVVGLGGLAWGWAGLAFAQSSDDSVYIIALAVGIIVSNAITAWLGVPYALLAFIVPATTPLFVTLAGGSPTMRFVAVLLVLLLAGAALYAYRIQRGLRTAQALQSENKDLKSKLRLSKSELSALIKARDQMESELSSARISAESANMAKGEFLATMSHEIRTPLNGILPILDILRGTKLSADQTDYLNTAYHSSRHLLAIIDDILDYSKIEAGKLELEDVGISIEELIRSVTQLMAKSAERKNLVLEAKIDTEVRRMVRGDPVRLRQVLTNLVSNAIKFTKRGRITISVSKAGDTRTHSEILFSVQDTGIGMNATTTKRVFQPFSQADASTTRNYGGTGLGLAICKRLVEVMRGEIGARSNPGQGSVFWFKVPMRKATGDVEPVRTELDDIRTLVVTNDHILYRRLSVYLDRWAMPHLRVDSAGDTLKQLRSAAQMGESWSYDLLVMDLQTLRHASINLAKNIRQDPILRNIKIIVIGRQGRQAASEVDAEAMDRDFSESELHTALHRLMEVEEADVALSSSETISIRPVASPTAEIPTLRASIASTPVAAAGARPSSRQARRLLLVEDNPVNLHVARKLLKVVGYQSDVARHGEEALKLLEEQTYAAILMDCQMPIMDGYTATRKIRAREAGHLDEPRTPIIAMTANAMAGDREKCLNAGMDDYMAKPLSRDLLEETLKKWVKDKAAGTEDENTQLSNAEPKPVARKAKIVIDQKVLGELVELMGDDIDEVIEIYLEDAPGYLATLQAAAAENDLHGMVAPAHSLKSSSANLGAIGLSEMAKAIEHGAREGNLDGPQRRVERMRAEFDSARRALQNRSSPA